MYTNPCETQGRRVGDVRAEGNWWVPRITDRGKYLYDLFKSENLVIGLYKKLATYDFIIHYILNDASFIEIEYWVIA